MSSGGFWKDFAISLFFVSRWAELKDFAICLFFGWAGVHKFREKKIGMGILYLCTFGLFFVGWFIDVVRYFVAVIKGKRIQEKESAR